LKSVLWLRCLGMGLLPQKARPRSIASRSICPIRGAHSIGVEKEKDILTVDAPAGSFEQYQLFSSRRMGPAHFSLER
jgi:hypothetical protein